MLKKILIILIICLFAISAVACNRNAKKNDKNTKVSAKTKKKILSDARKDIKLIESIKINIDDYEKALGGEALKAFKDESEANIKAGKVKIRRYTDAKISYVNLTKGLASLTLKFIDDSYYVNSSDMSQKISAPQSEKKNFIIHLRKNSGRWKIVLVIDLKE